MGNPQREPMSSAARRATAEVTVNDTRRKKFAAIAGVELVELVLQETFTGEIEGESEVRALQAVRSDRSVSQVSMQTFSGRLHGRQGSFALQGSGRVDEGKIDASWSVVPGSGTRDLAGLRGDGGFKGEFGKGSTATLDYWFE